MNTVKRFLRSSYGTMALVSAMYVVKASAKLGIGAHLHSPMISADGWHNFADIFEALFVIFMLWVARRPEGGKYPFGLKNAESIVAAVIGAGLLVFSVKLIAESAFGLITWIPAARAKLSGLGWFKREPLLMGPQYFGWAIGVTAGGCLTSFIFGRYEVATGKRNGNESLVADGRETLNDGLIEFATVVGVLGEYLFSQARLEYVFTLVVAVNMALTGKDILKRALAALLQRSIGSDVEQGLREIAMSTHGVVALAEIKTFRTGPKAVVLMKVITRKSGETQKLMKRGMAERMRPYLRSKEYAEADFFIRFEPPEPNPYRLAYAVAWKDGRDHLADDLAGATHLRICDMKDDEVKRCKDEPMTLVGAVGLIKKKRIREVFVGAGNPAEAAAVGRAGVTYSVSPSRDLSTLGFR